VAVNARDRQRALLQRLPKRVESRTVELGELIQKQDAVMDESA
jgi:hypothetical protein